MCGSKGSTVSSTSGPPQQFLQAYQDVYSQARGLTGQPYQSYTGPVVSGFTPDQLSAFGAVRNAQGLSAPYINQAASYMTSAGQPISPYSFGDGLSQLPGLGQSYFDWAGNAAQTAAGYANQATAPIKLMDYNVGPYLSPYTEDVTNALSKNFADNNATQFNQIRGNAGAQGAFGGDREAIAEAETARQQDLAQQQTLAGVRQQGFAQAQGEFNAEQQADLQRQLAERQYLLGAAGSTLGAGQLGMGIGSGLWGEFNTEQQADIGAQEASAYLQQQTGYGLAQLGNEAQNTALTGAQAQLGIGNQQQQLAQQLLNYPYYSFMQQQAYPYQQLGWLSNIATGLGGASGGTSSTTYPGPSTLSQIAGLGTAGAGIYGLGNQQGWWGGSSVPEGTPSAWQFDSAFGGLADGGGVKRAPGGAVGLGVPSEFGGSGIPGETDSTYIPGSHGMGDEPANKGGSGLNKMFMQPVTTQTQSGGGGGSALGTIASLGMKVLPFLLDDGGTVVPRGTLARGYDGGGPVRYQSHAAAPMVSDLTHVAAPSSFGPASAESVRPTMNYAPTFDPQGYPGPLTGVPNNWSNTEPMRLGMVNGILQRNAPAPVPVAAAPPMGLAMPPVGSGAVGVLPFDMGGNLGGGGASGGHVGAGGIGHYDDGGPVVPLQPPTPADQLQEKIRRIQQLEKLRTEDRFPQFGTMPPAQPRDAGGLVYPDLSRGYIPQAGAMAHGTMGPPKPPTSPSLQQQAQGATNSSTSASPIASFLQALGKSGALEGHAESSGGAVMPSAMPLQYDDGGMVPNGMMMRPPAQQQAQLQQYMSMPVEQLRMMAMRTPPTTPQGAAIQRALQMKQIMPAPSGNTGPTGPSGPSGQMYPGTTAARGGTMGLAATPDDDWIEPPPKDWKPGQPYERPRGLASGGEPEDAPFGPDLSNVQIVPANDTASVTEQPSGGLALPLPIKTPTKKSPGYVEGQYYPDIDAWNNAMDKRAESAPSLVNPLPPSGGLIAPPTTTSESAPDGTVVNTQDTPLAGPSQTPKAPEDILYDRVRRAEGTAGGSGFVVYGGDAFVPGPEHPGELARRVGPAGVTHAAGPGQWQPGTWNGLKPDFRARFGRDPVFSDDADQKQMTWLNAAKIYPGGEDKLRADLSTGTLNTKALAPQWAGFNASDGTTGGMTRAGGADQLVGPGTGKLGIGASGTMSAADGNLSNPPSFSLRTADTGSHTMRDIMSSPWTALIAAGAGMMASRSPFPGVAIGEGLQTGLKVAQLGATNENKDELAQVRMQSTENQARHMVDLAEQARTRASETSSHNQATEALRSQALAQQEAATQARLQTQQIQLAAQAAALEEKNRHNQATEQDHERQRQIQQQLAETRQQLTESQSKYGKWEPGRGVDANGQEVPGMYHLPRDGSDPVFHPGVQVRDQSSFKNSAQYVSRVQAQEKALQNAWQKDLGNIGKPMPNFHQQAATIVQQSFGEAGAVTGQQGAAPPAPTGAPPAPASAKPPTIQQNGYTYTLQPDGSYK